LLRFPKREGVFLKIFSRSFPQDLPTVVSDFLTVCLKICLLFLFQISSRFASRFAYCCYFRFGRALVEETPRKKRYYAVKFILSKHTFGSNRFSFLSQVRSN
jgi:hypothetical protein